jgi:hypothetical protein
MLATLFEVMSEETLGATDIIDTLTFVIVTCSSLLDLVQSWPFLQDVSS